MFSGPFWSYNLMVILAVLSETIFSRLVEVSSRSQKKNSQKANNNKSAASYLQKFSIRNMRVS